MAWAETDREHDYWGMNIRCFGCGTDTRKADTVLGPDGNLRCEECHAAGDCECGRVRAQCLTYNDPRADHGPVDPEDEAA